MKFIRYNNLNMYSFEITDCSLFVQYYTFITDEEGAFFEIRYY